MKQLTKAVSALCVLCLTYTATWAQAPTVAYTEHQFSYDVNGNRIKREQIFITVYLRTANPDSLSNEHQAESDQPEIFNDDLASAETNQPKQNESTRKRDLFLSGHKITAYPNPVSEQLNLEITGLNDKPGNTVRLYEMTGKLLIEKRLQSSMQVSFSDYPAGSYLLVIYIDGKRKEVEIIKN